MQFEARAVSLSVMISELIERMRRDAYSEGFADCLARLQKHQEPVRRAISASSAEVGTSSSLIGDARSTPPNSERCES